ncbi:hypothetical protein [Oryzomicrobium sp.]|uniref:hypothetical protein n=1 Tax=Oryzomicrobium sp. TaxID=1911578 RepID=UPI0025FC22A4|nr:hypothetical protein [Oryzomicrobium sp.]MCE1244218.1 hypothetical protein [Oryzomicrobium sp.]
MITTEAIASVQWLFDKAIRENAGAGAACEVTVSPGLGPAMADDARRHLVVIGISSYLFRMVVLFDFDAAPRTLDYLSRRAGGEPGALQGQLLADAYGELVNMICGAAKRTLHEVFPHTGLSTPFTLESSCARYVCALDPAHSLTFAVNIGDQGDGQLGFRMTVCLCVAPGTTLDFTVARTAPADASSDSCGEIEFF